jgi:hypothetical protein
MPVASAGEHEKEKLVASIRHAFSSSCYPGDDQLVGRVGVSECRDLGAESRASAVFRGKHWRDLLPQQLGEYQVCFWLSARGLAYYLPAYLIAALTDEEWGEGLARDITFRLTPPLERDQEGRKEFEEIVTCLSLEQKHVVRQFFEYRLAGQGGPRAPIDPDQFKKALIEDWRESDDPEKQEMIDYVGWKFQQDNDWERGDPAVALARYWARHIHLGG